jgi:hypothetical protein
MLARATQLIENPIDLACHDKIVLVQAFDLFGSQRDGRVTPAEADVRVMAFGLSQVTYVSNETERLLKIAKAVGSFDTVAIIAQFPIRRLRLKPLRFRMRERRNAAATRGAFLIGESLDHGWTSDDSLDAKDGAFQEKLIEQFILKRASAPAASPLPRRACPRNGEYLRQGVERTGSNAAEMTAQDMFGLTDLQPSPRLAPKPQSRTFAMLAVLSRAAQPGISTVRQSGPRRGASA